MTLQEIINKWSSKLNAVGVTINSDGSLSGDTTATAATSVVSGYQADLAKVDSNTTTTSATSNTTITSSKLSENPNAKFKLKEPEGFMGMLTQFAGWASGTSIDDVNKELNKLVANNDVDGIFKLANQFGNYDEIRNQDPNAFIVGAANQFDIDNFIVFNKAINAAIDKSGKEYIPTSASRVTIPDKILNMMVADTNASDTVGGTPLNRALDVQRQRDAAANAFDKGGREALKDFKTTSGIVPTLNEQIGAYQDAVFNNGMPILIAEKDGIKYGVKASTYYENYYVWANNELKKDKTFDITPSRSNRDKFEASTDGSSLLITKVSDDFIAKQTDLAWLNVNFKYSDINKITSDPAVPGVYYYDGELIDLEKYTDIKLGDETLANVLSRVTGNKDTYSDIFNKMGSSDALAEADAALSEEATKALKQYEQGIRTFAYENNLSWDDKRIADEATKLMGTNYVYDVEAMKGYYANQYSQLEAEGVTGQYQHWADKLKEGYTVRGLAGGYITTLATLYGISPEEIGLNDRLLEPAILTGKDGKISMSLADYKYWLKQQPEYERTEAGRQDASSFSALLRANAGA